MQTDYAQALFDSIPDSAILLDKTGRILDWNHGATSIFGYHKKETLGKSVNLIYQKNHSFPKIIQDILPQQKKWMLETRYVRKNGVQGLCKSILTLIPSNTTYKTSVLLTHQIISSYKAIETELMDKNLKLIQQTQLQSTLFYYANWLLLNNLNAIETVEAQLRESELRFHVLAENATDVISRHSPDGSYLYVSPSCKTQLGFTPEELLNCNSFKFIHYEDINKLKKAFNRRKQPAQKYQILTYRFRRKEGDYRWFESNIRHIYDEKNHLLREIQSASRDITDRVLDKKARLRGQQLAHVSRLSSMEEMASGMAHEINQPLAAIVNYTQGCVRYLQNSEFDTQQVMEIMKKAVAQAERAGEVIHRLKNFFCKGQLFKTTCKMNSIIRETVSLSRSDLNISKTKIDFDLAKNLHLISADKIQIQQVLLNLIQNAIDAMQETPHSKRRIHIQTRANNSDTIEITVRDSGPGFPKDVTEKVFQPFFTTKAHGRGMGLAICRSIIEAHGGQFVINPNSNVQSWIRFILPIY